MTKTIDNSDDIIDSRDVIEHVRELESEIEDLEEELLELSLHGDLEGSEEAGVLATDIAELRDELAPLKAFADEGEHDAEDWTYGATLIRHTYFVEYAKQLADDIGAISADANWPLSHIDWEAAAEELSTDYSTITFDGVEYWVR